MLRPARALALLVVLCITACGSSSRGGRNDGGGDRDATPGGDGGDRTDAGGGDGGSSGDGGGGTSYPLCRIGCASASDCGSASAAYDDDNYDCDADGLCRYTGCNDDTECTESFMSSSYACRDVGGQPTCVQTCTSASDCGSASGAYDADNYECDADGRCRYTGCNDDAECAESFMDDRYGCRPVEPPDRGLPLPTATDNCVLTCDTSEDCVTASAAFDADNYQCDGGVCRYRGCNDDAECADSFMDDRYVCR
ncbi:MAG: hypothetical protein ACOCUS_00270 [Polyangiales bacterium]